MRKAVFAWASIAGADPEPVEVIGTGKGERKGVLTTGCNDPFWLDDPSAGVLLYARMERPENLVTQEEQDALEKEYALEEERRNKRHSWRGPR